MTTESDDLVTILSDLLQKQVSDLTAQTANKLAQYTPNQDALVWEATLYNMLVQVCNEKAQLLGGGMESSEL
jgi:hypothetical protein